MQGDTIGGRVHRIRTQKRWSMHQLAERIGTTHSYISQLEHDRIRPGIDLVTRLAEVFEVSIDHLVGREESGTVAPAGNLISEGRANYVAGEGDATTDPGSSPASPILAAIQSDLHEIAAHDPAALEYIASMVRAIKDKAVGDNQEEPRTGSV
ncbi:MAG: helix-turn-helix domain-containing protein [Chloroflexota bacterium]|nr:helix-turn-helix domain-containing protein [Chloroflexota bacterium]